MGGWPTAVNTTYLYDAEGRICAVHGVYGMTGYQYDADGVRVGKGTITSMSCDPSVNGYVASNDYILDQSGDQMTETVPSGKGWMQWSHTNVWADGALVATYDTAGLHFYLNDPLGTRRVQTDAAGRIEQNCRSLPYGDALQCPLADPTEHHFTGKERDTETGLDYFGARYYNSAFGRWMSPDLPFADQNPNDPQSWNLYMYAGNSPLSYSDLNGRGKVSQVAWGILTGVGNFVYHNTPIPNAIEAVKDLSNIHEAMISHEVRRQAEVKVIKELGSSQGRQYLVKQAEAVWNGMSLTQKTSTVTQAALTIATIVATGAAGGEAAPAAIESESGNIPATVVRVIPQKYGLSPPMLGPEGKDVFVTTSGVLDGMSATEITNALKIRPSPSGYNLFEFPTPDGIACPVNRTDPGFVEGGFTGGGLPEFVIPNGPVPANATVTTVKPD